MRTIFLLGILISLTVIATKRDDQTAMDAAMEFGQKARSLVADYDRTGHVNKALATVEETSKTVGKGLDPFVRQAKEALTKSNQPLPRKTPEPKIIEQAEKTLPPVASKPVAVKKASPKNPEWIMPKARELAMPDIPALPKAPVEELSLEPEPAVQIAKAEPAVIDVGRSYSMVKGYYENASRLLEEIK